MCEIFPEFENCCLLVSLRIGLLFISVLAIISGAIMLTAIEQSTDVSFDNLKNVTQIRDPKKAYSNLTSLINSGLTFIAVCYMLLGALLLAANLGNSVGFVQVFVWGIFINVIFGFILVIAICYECVFKEDQCILKSMDWLSASAFLVVVVLFLFLDGKWRAEWRARDAALIEPVKQTCGPGDIHLPYLLVSALSLWIYFVSIANSYVLQP